MKESVSARAILLSVLSPDFGTSAGSGGSVGLVGAYRLDSHIPLLAAAPQLFSIALAPSVMVCRMGPVRSWPRTPAWLERVLKKFRTFMANAM